MKLKQILLNLIQNGIQHSTQGDVIVSAEGETGQCGLEGRE